MESAARICKTKISFPPWRNSLNHLPSKHIEIRYAWLPVCLATELKQKPVCSPQRTLALGHSQETHHQPSHQERISVCLRASASAEAMPAPPRRPEKMTKQAGLLGSLMFFGFLRQSAVLLLWYTKTMTAIRADSCLFLLPSDSPLFTNKISEIRELTLHSHLTLFPSEDQPSSSSASVHYDPFSEPLGGLPWTSPASTPSVTSMKPVSPSSFNPKPSSWIFANGTTGRQVTRDSGRNPTQSTSCAALEVERLWKRESDASRTRDAEDNTNACGGKPPGPAPALLRPYTSYPHGQVFCLGNRLFLGRTPHRSIRRARTKSRTQWVPARATGWARPVSRSARANLQSGERVNSGPCRKRNTYDVCVSISFGIESDAHQSHTSTFPARSPKWRLL